MRTRRLMVLLVLLTTAAGCGTQHGTGSPNPAGLTVSGQPPAGGHDPVEALAAEPPRDPSDFQWQDQVFHFLTEDGQVLDEQPWTACLGNGCWDGAPGLSGPIPSVGSPDALYFAIDYQGWTFHDVSFNPVDDECGGRPMTVRAEPVSDRVFRVDPAGLTGEWRVDVFGRAPEGGDAVTSVRWTTPDHRSATEHAGSSTPSPCASGSARER